VGSQGLARGRGVELAALLERYGRWLGFAFKLSSVWILVLVSMALLGEGAARLVVSDPQTAVVADTQETLTLPGCPDFGQAFDFDPRLFWVLKPRLNAWRVNGNFESSPVDFCFSTTDARLRAMPELPGTERYRVLAVGDSCTFGFGVDDDKSWPAQLQTLLNAERTEGFVRVINAGVPGYTSFQGLQYLKDYGLALEPSLVIVSFWVNDEVPSFSISDEQRAAQYARIGYDSPLMYSRFYVGLKQLVRNTSLPSWKVNTSRPRLTEEEYEGTLKAICETCGANGVPVVLFMWPPKFQTILHARSLGYQLVAEKVASSVGAPFVSLVPEFNASPQKVYVDSIHGNETGCSIAARRLAVEVSRLLGL
jgi:lysophospholipase L1-like esterase